MNRARRHLQQLIAEDGPISIARYMAEALGNPEYGYYMSRDPLGAAGDFVTAPEISQTFGELIGLWCVSRWHALGRPDPLLLIEAGPGRGTLMADALRAARLDAAFMGAVKLCLIETSPALRAMQAKQLEARWFDRLADIENGPFIFIANEFLDALPVHQLVRRGDGWRQVMIGLDGTPPALSYCETKADPDGLPDLLPAALADAEEGAVAEICPAARSLVGEIAARLVAHSGSALLIDYGHTESATGDTLQAVSKHRFVSVLQDPGNADITAHVDFAALARVATGAGAAVYGPVTQGDFLCRLGIRRRQLALLARATAERKTEISGAIERLLSPAAMGTLFKAMALQSPGLEAAEGFS